ncbi:MAG: Fe-S cluster assembly protein SufD [Omnitrophica bacterium RIFCSPLOWO2_12_FULL_50_11]|nr:MAG: Fe-S cluster assembly protein SufD [Omnitrophica bacterium RIFCSPLOWO2_12_FULL_50_11]
MASREETITRKGDSKGNHYLSVCESFLAKIDSRDPFWVQTLRQDALARFRELGFPTTREEQWKYTNVRAIQEANFEPAPREALPKIKKEEVEKLSTCPLRWHRLVFVNGVYSKEFSRLSDLSGAFHVGTIQDAIRTKPKMLEQYLAQCARYDRNGFAALNTALIQDGTFIYMAEGKEFETPIELVFLTDSERGNVMSQPRNLIVFGRSSRATLIESYFSFSDDPYFTNVVTEVVLGDGAVCDYVRLQREGRKAFHISTTQVEVGRNSVFSSVAVDLGGKLVRNNLTVELTEEGAQCDLNGLYLTSDDQHVDNHTLIEHPKPNGTSRQLYKGILDGASTTVFGGKIWVHQDAQKTDAHQTNKNLLLSEHATVDTKPQLEIFADDVKCTHGAAVGQIDEDSVFYLKSRGLPEAKARQLVSYGFANEVVERIKVPSIRAELNQIVLERCERQGSGKAVAS